LLEIVKRIINDEQTAPKPIMDDGEEVKNEGNTYQDDEAEIAIEMLGVFITQ